MVVVLVAVSWENTLEVLTCIAAGRVDECWAVSVVVEVQVHVLD